MTSYRFCRSDDIPLLVAAHNSCYRPHFDGLEELTVDAFKALVRSHDLWTSSCMVAQAAGEPIAVLLAGKRDDASLVYRLGVRPGHERQGHGRHLLTSLSQKLAILGPPTLRAEIRDDLVGGRALLEACGYRHERTCPDYRRAAPCTSPSEADALVVPVTPGELAVEVGEGPAVERPWLRDPSRLSSPATGLRGVAVASEVRVEAWVIYWPTDSGAAIFDLGAASLERRAPLLALLLDHVARDHGDLDFHGVAPCEMDPGEASRLGFDEVSRTNFYSATATPA